MVSVLLYWTVLAWAGERAAADWSDTAADNALHLAA
jgi:hypothetical protein